MVANRYLGNPTDRDDNGGLRNRLCHGSRTEAPREIEGIAIGPYCACAPHFYPNNLRLLRPERRQCGFKSWERPAVGEIRFGSAALEPEVDEVWISLSDAP